MQTTSQQCRSCGSTTPQSLQMCAAPLSATLPLLCAEPYVCAMQLGVQVFDSLLLLAGAAAGASGVGCPTDCHPHTVAMQCASYTKWWCGAGWRQQQVGHESLCALITFNSNGRGWLSLRLQTGLALFEARAAAIVPAVRALPADTAALFTQTDACKACIAVMLENAHQCSPLCPWLSKSIRPSSFPHTSHSLVLLCFHLQEAHSPL